MTELITTVNEQVSRLFKNFSESEDFSIDELKNTLLEIELDSEQSITTLNSFLQKQLKSVLMKIMENGNLEKVSKLISLICDVSSGKNQGPNKRPIIKESLLITVVYDVLECLGINDLKFILPTITQKICSLKQLDFDDQNRMLTVINYLLKRISKTQDYFIRGQLQFTLTKILPICHDSGFHYRVPTAKGIQITEETEEFKQMAPADGITYQFYKDFWQLQKYLMDPNQLGFDGNEKEKTELASTKKNPLYKTEPLILLRLKNMEKVLTEVISYMNRHPCDQNKISLLNQPIKFLANTHLLEYQLSDAYFRKIVLVQILLFTFTLKHLKPTGNILKGVMLTEAERQVINKIDQIAQRYLESLQKTLSNEENPNPSLSLIEAMKHFFSNELEWLQLKDYWKEKKKFFLRTQPIAIPELEQNQKKHKEPVDYNRKIQEVQNRIAKQMNIGGDNILRFLTEPNVPHIVTTPSQTSFASFWSQGKSCLNSFDYEKSQQFEFQSKSEYNMFEWKALRSLYRETVKQFCLGERNPQLKEYKALAYIQNKQNQFRGKEQTTIEQVPVNNQQNGPTLYVIPQARQSQEVSSSRRQAQLNTEENKPQQSLGELKEQNQEEKSPSKKVKTE